MNELKINEDTTTITTLEIAEMMGIQHWQILRKLDGQEKEGKHVKGIIEILADNYVVVSDYFTESLYKDESGKENRCYNVTKMGCDFLANKFIGEKGILFTAKYVKRFSEMERIILSDEQLKAKLLLSIYIGGQEAVVASKQLSQLEVVAATTPLLETIEEQKPKAEFHDVVHKSINSISIGKFSGVLQKNPNFKKFGRNKLFQWLRDNDYLCERGDLKNKPTQKSLSGDYMDYEENATDNGYGKSITTYKPLITGKGQIYFTRKLLEDF